MRDFPSCFGENGVQISDSSIPSTGKASQNSITCVYQSQFSQISCLITLTWTKNLMGQGLTITIDDSNNHQCLCKVDIKPWLLFSKRKGYKNLDTNLKIIEIYWDFSSAKFGSGPEPVEGFYLAVMINQELVLLVGDLRNEAYRKIDTTPIDHSDAKASFIAKREHISGKNFFYTTKAQFRDKGPTHDIIIECDTSSGVGDPFLVIRIDRKVVMMVKRLRWKFRGNQTVLVDGFPVEVLWDVHNWVFGNFMGSAVFMFQTSCLEAEKVWASQPICDHTVLSWSQLKRIRDDSQLQGLGFSLILCAWKNE